MGRSTTSTGTSSSKALGRRPSRIETLQVQIDGRPRYLDVRSWPEDDLWAKRVRDRLTTGLVALHDLNGLDWPVVGPLQVTESATRSLNGYAGFYDPGGHGVLDEITISEEPDDQVIVHEAAHAWFNDGLLTGRWISEGFADAYAARALTRLGSTPPPAGSGRPRHERRLPAQPLGAAGADRRRRRPGARGLRL